MRRPRIECVWAACVMGALGLGSASCSSGNSQTAPGDDLGSLVDATSDAPADTAADNGTARPPLALSVARLFPSSDAPSITFPSCVYASPLATGADDGQTQDDDAIVVASTDRVVGLDPLDGHELWHVVLPAPEGELPMVVATPVLVGSLLVVAYHTTADVASRDVNTHRLRDLVAVVNLESGPALDSRFPTLELSGSFPAAGGGRVVFDPAQHLGRAALVHGLAPGDALGRVYVTFGNARDIQPWHGWVFEVDLDEWRDAGPQAAITATLVDTPETDCNTPGQSGSTERICGGGLWAPSGPLLVQRGDQGFQLFLAPDNGQLDLQRGDYANTLMRTGPGLAFDAGCDPGACADFDADAPSDACTESCDSLFIPRPAGTFPRPESGVCDGLDFFVCWAQLDYGGGSTPVYLDPPDGPPVLAYPMKDGAVYLVDADHLGTLYDREQLVSICGTPDDPCLWDWAGMIVTQPAVTEVDGRPFVVVPTFMPDLTHPAGVVGLSLEQSSSGPDLVVRWRVPDPSSPEAVNRFRRHPTRAAVAEMAAPGEDPVPVVWLADTAAGGGIARLVAIRADTGEALVDTPMAGPGYRFTLPLVHDGNVYLPSCESDFGRGSLEGYRVTTSLP